MELALLALATVLITSYLIRYKIPNKIKTKEYLYLKKNSIMTQSEISFYNKLKNLTEDKYYIVPQAHLSSLLSEKVKGQSWRGAFSRINGKSVDFLLCKNDTFEPFVAIELDDYTHEREDRISRDNLVNSIFENSKIPLVRFRSGEWETEDMIFEKVRMGIELVNQKTDLSALDK